MVFRTPFAGYDTDPILHALKSTMAVVPCLCIYVRIGDIRHFIPACTDIKNDEVKIKNKGPFGNFCVLFQWIRISGGIQKSSRSSVSNTTDLCESTSNLMSLSILDC